MTDPIADMLTRIRNALTAKHETVEVPASKIKVAIADILVKEGYIKGYEIVDGAVQNNIVITLKYAPVKGQKVVTGLKRVSTPGLRVYAGVDNLLGRLFGFNAEHKTETADRFNTLCALKLGDNICGFFRKYPKPRLVLLLTF